MSDPVARIALTPGEPAGIGPDLCLSLAQQTLDSELVTICDPGLLEERAAQLQVPFHSRLFDPALPARSTPGEICVLPVSLQTPTRSGKLDPANARDVLDSLDRAISGCQSRVMHTLTCEIGTWVVARATRSSLLASSMTTSAVLVAFARYPV